jgi:hypothetical protein
MSGEEWLMVLNPDTPSGLAQARAHARVTHVASSRLVGIEAEPSAESALAALPGIEGLSEACFLVSCTSSAAAARCHLAFSALSA